MSKIKSFLNLQEGEQSKEKILKEVANNAIFKGVNIWVLACAIIIASIGLNINSTAVIIGAMLISPLMGPIVGAGFAIGTYDFTLLQIALKNLLVATVVSLMASTLYFIISPFKDAQSELLARTTPTIYDVLIAFFGGLVGAIAITRVEKGNPVPGVAIATALMPPLCTAGYGLATGNFVFFLGAFYLYSINCVFICIATFLIVKYLKYPSKIQIDERRQKQVRITITSLIILMLLPSTYLAYSLFREQRFRKNAEYFIEKEFSEKGNTIVYKKLKYNKKTHEIELAFLSKRFNKKEMEDLTEKLPLYKIDDTKLIIRQDTTDKLQILKGDILKELKINTSVLYERETYITQLESQIKNNSFDDIQLLEEVKAIFSSIRSLSIANHAYISASDSSKIITVVIYASSKPLSNEDSKKMNNWLKKRLNVPSIEIYKQLE